MRPEEALDLAIEGLMERSTEVVSMAEYVRRVGGTKEAAQRFINPKTGRPYTQRTVERWITQAKQRRGVPKRVLLRVSRDAVERRLKREGVKVLGAAGIITISNDTRRRKTGSTVTVPPEVLQRAFAWREEGDRHNYGYMFGAGYLNAYTGGNGGYFSDEEGGEDDGEVSYFMLDWAEEGEE